MVLKIRYYITYLLLLAARKTCVFVETYDAINKALAWEVDLKDTLD